MNIEEFKQKLKALGINQRDLANDLGITSQQVTNWNKKNAYPNYVNLYFENIHNKKDLAELRNRIKNILNNE